MRSLAFCSLLALLAAPAPALEPYLVKDVDPVPGPADSHPAGLAAMGGAVLFSAGRRHLRPPALEERQVQPPAFPGFDPVRAGDRVFFPGYDPATGWELWTVRP